MTKQLEALIARLKGRYGPTEVPKCRICSGKLSLQRSGTGGDVWACSGQIDDEDGWQYAPGRSIADTHYQESRWHDYSGGGDADMIELIAALEQSQQTEETLKSRNRRLDGIISAAEKRIAELEARPLEVKLPTPATTFDAASAIRACMDEFPLAVQDIVEECAVIAENTIRAAGGTVSEGE